MSRFTDKSSKIIDIVFSEEVFCFYIISCMIAVPLTEFIAELMGQTLVAEQVVFSVYGIVGLFLCTGKLALKPTGRHWSDFFFFTLHIFMFLSLIYSCDIARILRKNATSNEYPAFFVGYYCMMYAGFQLSKKKLRQFVLAAFLLLALLEGILGIFQTFGIAPLPMLWTEWILEVFGLTPNSNLFGALSVLFVGACGGMFIFAEKKGFRIAAGVLTIISIYCSVHSLARLAWLGDGIVVMTYFISLLIMMKRNKGDEKYKIMFKRFLLWLAFIAGGIVLAILKSNSLSKRIEVTSNEISAVTEQGDITRVGSHRGVIWSFCLEALPRHWVTGVGLDNLKQCYLENRKWVQGMYYSNQAHNEYLQVLTTQGVFAFINYIALIITSTVMGIKRVIKNDDDTDRFITWTYLAMFAGFSCAMFFLFRSFTVEPYYFAVIGLMNPRVHKKIADRK